MNNFHMKISQFILTYKQFTSWEVDRRKHLFCPTGSRHLVGQCNGNLATVTGKIAKQVSRP